MEHPCAILRAENQSILAILEVLEEICFLLRAEQEILQMDVVGIADFLDRYAEQFHNGKESQYLYPAMAAAGLFQDDPQTLALLKAHHTGKAFINEMKRVAAGEAFEKEDFIRHAESYIEHMRQHIDTEETIVLPLAQSSLQATVIAELQRNFQDWEQSGMGTGTAGDFQKLTQYFRQKYLHNE